MTYNGFYGRVLREINYYYLTLTTWRVSLFHSFLKKKNKKNKKKTKKKTKNKNSVFHTEAGIFLFFCRFEAEIFL